MKNLRIIEAKIGEQVFPLSHHTIESDGSSNHISVVIGNNATGKSRLLAGMLNCLRQGTNYRAKNRVDDIEITILSGDTVSCISKGNPGISSKLNLISISNSLFDKFPIEGTLDLNYAYIGTKSASIGSPTSFITNDLMDALSSHLENLSFRNKASEIFSFIGLKPIINIVLSPSYRSSNKAIQELLGNSSTATRLIKYLKVEISRGVYRVQRKSLLKSLDNANFMLGFHTFLASTFKQFISSDAPTLEYLIKIDEPDENTEFIHEYRFFSFLRQLRLISYNGIFVQKGDHIYDINDSSTGEIGLLTTFIRAIPHLKPNSIIFIDEPEISLHPSWQMQYISLLQKFLEGYTGCHVIIATHSHLILSDLRNEWSSVLTLRAGENNQVIAKLRPYTPFGWSPEAILYEVFGVATVRNQLFEHELSKMLELIAIDSDDVPKIQEYIDKFESFQYSEADPLNLVIQEAKEYVASK